MATYREHVEFNTIDMSGTLEDEGEMLDPSSRAVQSHVLRRSRILCWRLVGMQTVLSFVVVCALSDRSVRTGRAHTLGIMAALLCGLEGIVHIAARLTKRVTFYLETVAVVTCVLSYAGVVGLVTNTEDDKHSVPVDTIEAAACIFVAAWGCMTARLAASAVEREATRECTFELKFMA